MDECNGVIAGGQALDFELPFGSVTRVERALVTVDENANSRGCWCTSRAGKFFAGEGFLERGAAEEVVDSFPFEVVLGGG